MPMIYHNQKPHAFSMHAKTSKEIVHATWYLKEKLIVVADPDVLLCLPALPFPYYSKTPTIPHSSKNTPRKI